MTQGERGGGLGKAREREKSGGGEEREGVGDLFDVQCKCRRGVMSVKREKVASD